MLGTNTSVARIRNRDVGPPPRGEKRPTTYMAARKATWKKLLRRPDRRIFLAFIGVLYSEGEVPNTWSQIGELTPNRLSGHLK